MKGNVSQHNTENSEQKWKAKQISLSGEEREAG